MAWEWIDDRNFCLKGAGIAKLIGNRLGKRKGERTSCSNVSENFSFSLLYMVHSHGNNQTLDFSITLSSQLFQVVQ